MEKMKYYGQDEYFMDKIKYMTWCFPWRTWCFPWSTWCFWWSTWAKVAPPRTIFKLVGPCEILSHGQKVPQKATKLSKISLKKINSTFETSVHNYASVAQWSERLTRMDLPMRVSWVRIPARELYSFFVGFSGFYFFPIFKNCLWQFVELFFSKSLLFLWLVSNTLQHTCPAPCRP